MEQKNMELDLLKYVRNIPDFPKKGIQFKDVTTIAKDPIAFKYTIDKLYEHYKDKKIDKVCAIESRGFVFGAPLAYLLNAGFILIRKPGKLPADTYSESYELEYGTNTIEMHKDAINNGEKVLVFDDLLATGGTVEATINLIKKAGGEVVGIAFVIELTGSLHGRERLKGYDIFSLLEIPVEE
ncbi:MAG: adenine phosphoribosyltransferase [Promethearchaeota archaeon]